MKQPATLPTLRRQGAALTVLALAVVLAALAGLCFGSQGYTPLRLWQAWCSGDPQNAVYRVLLHVRWPRTLAGLLAGSALAAAGVLLQAVLNNAMASPNVIGVNAGAGLAALCAAALWPAHPGAVQPAAFAGALAAALLVYGLALGAGVSRTTLVLAGLAVQDKSRVRVLDAGHIRRGYADLAGDLRRLGADCRAGRTGTEAGRQTKKL